MRCRPACRGLRSRSAERGHRRPGRWTPSATPAPIRRRGSSGPSKRGDDDPVALDDLRLALYDGVEPVSLERVERLQREHEEFRVVAIVVEKNVQRVLERIAGEVFATDVNRVEGPPTLAERPSVVAG